MVRPFRHEVLRYGDWSRAAEFRYNTPFQWGSKRTGPDLHRVGGKYANLWHYLHLDDPRATSPGSNMPRYHFLKDGRVDLDGIGQKMKVLRILGVPYDDESIATAAAVAQGQAALITDDLASQSVELAPDSDMTALIAYLQRLGREPQPLTAEPEVAEAEVE